MRLIVSQLGEDVAYTRGFSTSPVTVRGVFTNGYRAAELGFVGVTGTDPVFAAMSADLGECKTGDTLVRAGVTYKVRTPRPDDPSGVTVLDLKRA